MSSRAGGLRALLICIGGVAGVANAAVPSPGVDGARIAAADRQPENWLVAGGDYQEQRFSRLSEVNGDTAARLGLAWYYDIPTRLGQEATPVVVDGVMYVTTDGAVVHAFDAQDGRLLWRYDPRALSGMVNSCCGANNRGVAVWKGRVYVGTLDGRLIALDASDGRVVWSVMTVNAKQPYTISQVPRIVHDKVIIGNGGAELGVRGYISAYDAATGHLAWRFYTVPGEPGRPDHAASDAVIEAKARATWTGEYWRRGAGGTVWDSMAYDPQLNLLYIGVGNGSPWNVAVRSPGGGDNLFLSSIVALDPDTGRYVWHYQTTPGEAWDYTATQSIILADLVVAGEVRQVLMQAPKNGFFYVLDRRTGALISANNYAPVNWASGIDPVSGRPVERPEARYYKTGKPTLVLPGSSGAHNWQSMAFSPDTGYAYFPAHNLPMVFASDPNEVVGTKKTNVNVMFDGAAPLTAGDLEAARKAQTGWLAAWDPVKQREAWRRELPHYWNGGVLATAGGLVFQGNGGGEFVAYDARTGDVRWRFAAGTGIVASPMAYRVGGKQYIAVMAGWGGVLPLLGGGLTAVTGRELGPNRLLVFALDGHEALPANPPLPAMAPVNASSSGSVKAGGELYSRYCFRCHGLGAVGGGITPDLRASGATAQPQIFKRIVVDGLLQDRGMSGFTREISPRDAENIRAYLIQRARDSTTATRAD